MSFFLGCPCTNLVGNLPERKTLGAILQNNQKTADPDRKRTNVHWWAVPVQTGRKSTGKKNPCNHLAIYFGAFFGAWDRPLSVEREREREKCVNMRDQPLSEREREKCLSIEMHFFV